LASGGGALRVAIFGATGLAGTGVVRAWLEDPRVAEVRAVTRRALSLAEPGLNEIHCENFLELEPIAPMLRELDAVCFCLGISASKAKSKADYRRVTHVALAAGRATPIIGPRTLEPAADNLSAARVALDASDLERIDALVPPKSAAVRYYDEAAGIDTRPHRERSVV
jgi:uncharacterized protein YbjT (DUF2867 family)